MARTRASSRRSREAQRHDPGGMALEHHAHRVHAVDGFACPSPLAFFGEREIDEPFDGIHGRDHDTQMSAGAQAPAAAPPAPRVTVLLHDIAVVVQGVDVQQPIDRNVQDLHEAAELHHGGDQAMESLPDPLL